MSNKKKVTMAESDQSVISGLGHNPSVIEEVSFDEMDIPQATSTAANKKLREDLIRQHLDNYEESHGIEFTDCHQFMKPREIFHPDHKTKSHQEHTEAQSQEPEFKFPTAQPKESSSFSVMMELPLINVENMSGLSSSTLLLDGNGLLQSDSSPLSTAPISSNFAHPTGPADQYVTVGPESFEFQKPLPTVNQYYTLNATSQFKAGEEIESNTEGLPSSLLAPQQSFLLESAVEKDQSKCVKFQAYSLEQNSRQPQDNTECIEYGDVYVENNVVFDAHQISARSTTIGDGMEDSKLFTTSCNSLGSLGEGDWGSSYANNFSDIIKERDAQCASFEADQADFAKMMEVEEFHDLDTDLLAEEEKESLKKNVFIQEEPCTGSDVDISCFSGIHSVNEITVRPSWITSPDKKLLRPGNRMQVDEYMKLRSEALGFLGHDDDVERPDFGFEKPVHSPPGLTKPIPLLEVSSVDYNMTEFETSVETEYHDKENASNLTGTSNWSRESSKGSSDNRSSSSTFQDSSSASSSQGSQCSIGSGSSSPYESQTSSVVRKSAASSNIGKNYSDSADSAVQSVNEKSGIKRSFATPNVNQSRPHLITNEQKSVKDVMNAGKQKDYQKVEKSLHEGQNVLDDEQMHGLVKGVSASDDPKGLIERIIQMTKNPTMHNTLNMTDLDISTEVYELRKQRQALMTKKEMSVDVANKENANKKKFPIPPKKSDIVTLQSEKPPLQCMKNMNRNLESDRMPHKHMEKLKVAKTNSVPTNLRENDAPLRNVKYSITEDISIDETIKEPSYKSRILEDTQKLQLQSFHDSTNSGFDASTPYVCKSKSKSENSSQNEIIQEEPSEPSTGIKEHYENVKSHYIKGATPKMSVSSKSKLSAVMNAPKNKENLCYSNISDTDSKLSGMQNRMILSNTANQENMMSKKKYLGDLGTVSHSGILTSVRSSSVPTGLQGIGIAGNTVEAGCTLPVQHVQALRQHRSQENVTQEVADNTGDQFYMPQKLVFPDTCLLGMVSHASFIFHNPQQRWVQLSVRLVQEKLNDRRAHISSLILKPSYFVEPRRTCEIKVGVCSQLAGFLEACLEVCVSGLSKDSGTMLNDPHGSKHIVTVCATIEEPSVKLVCDGEDIIDFGVVPEGCTVSKEISVINQSPLSLPVILVLQQVASTSPIFYWSSEKEKTIHQISATHMACELPAAPSVSGPVPVSLKVNLKAPHLDKVNVDASGVVGVKSQLHVELDCPNQSTIIIASLCIKVLIGAVRLQSLRTSGPVILETPLGHSTNAAVSLKNSSSFPLRISFDIRSQRDFFSVHPCSAVIQPNSQLSPNLVFTPKDQVGRMESVLLMKIEPEGMVFEMAVVGVSQVPSTSHTSLELPVHGHKGISRASSVPLSNMSQENVAKFLESTKSRLVFGTVKVGTKASQKFVLRTNPTSPTLSITLAIRGSSAFQVGEYGGTCSYSRMEVVLKPCEEYPLSIHFCPQTVEALSATLIFKPREVDEPIKFQIPLQGYGGKSELEMPDIHDEKLLVIRDLVPQLPTMFITALANKGDRAMFIKLQAFKDEKYTEVVSCHDIGIQPQQFVLAPKSSRDVYIVIPGTQNILDKTPGAIGFLQIIYGDEILRKRFRRLKYKEVKTRRIHDPSLLRIDWNVSIPGEEVVKNEEDGLPPQHEDGVNFFNSCSKFQVQLNGEQRPCDDASSTVFACLDPEKTVMHSVADLTINVDRLADTQLSGTQDSYAMDRAAEKNEDDKRSHRSTTCDATARSSQSWDVFPKSLTLQASDPSCQTLFVANFTNDQQMFEAKPSFSWLTVEPREAILPGQSTVRLSLKVNPSRLPRPFTNSLMQTVEIMGENESRIVTVTAVPDKMPESAQTTSPAPVSVMNFPSSSNTMGRTDSNSQGPNIRQSCSENIGTNVMNMERKKTSQQSLSRTSAQDPAFTICNAIPAASLDPSCKPSKTKKIMVQVIPKHLVFPDTMPSKECCTKIQLHNRNSVGWSVKAEVTRGPFAVRHTDFKMKAGHYISLPIFFRPHMIGTFSGQLLLTLVEEQEHLIVDLNGKCVTE